MHWIKARWRIGWVLGLASILCGVATAREAVASAELRDIALTESAAGTRLSLTLSGKVADHVFKLTNPERIVVDLDDTRLRTGARLPAADGLIRSLRIGPQPKRTLRVVVELRSAQATRAGRVIWLRGSTAREFRLLLEVPGGAVASAASEPPPEEASAMHPAHAPIETGRDVVVAVDAGHGGEDPGAIGPDGTREKDVVLGIARALAEAIDHEPGMHAVLTRDGDYFIALRERINRARAAKADLFVSIHADSVRDGDVSGASVYVLSEKGATNEAARWLAERENAADLKGGVKLDDKDRSLASVLLDLSQNASIGASSEAAERVLAAIDRVGGVRKSQVQQAGFVVLKSPDIPSMLVETAYISNPREERLLREPAHQRELAHAIFEGVRGYFEASPPDGSRLALEKRAAGSLVLAGRAAP